MSGYFFSFEGIDGSGKTTQANLLMEHLSKSGYETLLTREPGGTPVGEKIRKILLENNCHAMNITTELLLLVASRVQHIQDVIQPALEADQIVLIDRFSDATRAYQGYGGGCSLESIEQILKLSGCCLEPNLTFILDIPVEKSFQRLFESKDRFENKKSSYFEKVREGYLDLAKKYPNRVKVINAEDSLQDVFEKVKGYVDEFIA
ncbi:dTMP kinase [PVC group bacterium (ex Bugula neritina AB1)]|nr:dTMP kinase [PVC group bacterium (ex Bugula neritina AB1)]